MSGKMISIKVKDFGSFHNTLVKMYIQRSLDNEETVFIQYGFYNKDFLPCTALLNENRVFIQKAGVGKLGDIKLTSKEWILALSAMKSKVLLQIWKDKLNNKEAA